MLPVALTVVADTNVPKTLPPATLAVDVMLPVAVINPPVVIFPPVMLPLALINPVRDDMLAVPVTLPPNVGEVRVLLVRVCVVLNPTVATPPGVTPSCVLIV
jgi:hypothetical protein